VSQRLVTVFGGTGFLGREVVRRLHDHGFVVRIATPHRHRSSMLFGRDEPRLQSIEADIRDERSMAGAIADVYGVVNAVSLYVEHGDNTFRAVHVDGARRLAGIANRAGVARFVHVSGIGADAASPSPYIRSRGEGESAVRAAFPRAVVVRPAVMFGPDDSFLSVLVQLLRRTPVFPMFGTGLTRLQPVYVGDIAEAIARVMTQPETDPITFECGGPGTYTFKGLLRTIAREIKRTPILMPVPFVLWRVLARVGEFLPTPPITRNQVDLMQVDNVASLQMPGLRHLSISPEPLEPVVRQLAQRTG
jgi:uncharacterized protein YbjT (DUF2867 family)